MLFIFSSNKYIAFKFCRRYAGRMKTLNAYFKRAVAEKEAIYNKHKKDLELLKRLEKRSKKLPIIWNETVNSKNAVRVIQVSQILNAFCERLELKKHVKLSEVSLSTYQLWRLTQLPSVTTNSGPTVNFRSHLHWLKLKDFLTLDEELGEWKLTSKAMDRIKNV